MKTRWSSTVILLSCTKGAQHTQTTITVHVHCMQCSVNIWITNGSLICPPVCCCMSQSCQAAVFVMMMQCPINTWSMGGENVPCTQCPANTVSPSASTNINACVCLPGTKPATSGCEQCASGEVCPGGTSVGGQTPVCPPGFTSPPGSDSQADCVCQAGYGKLIMDKLFSLACCHMYVHLKQLVAKQPSSPCKNMLEFLSCCQVSV
jgi:hypothetical protein